jgi:LytTr DNA-binding domain
MSMAQPSGLECSLPSRVTYASTASDAGDLTISNAPCSAPHMRRHEAPGDRGGLGTRWGLVRSDSKYTLVAYRSEAGQFGEAIIRVGLKDLVARLDPGQFAQGHRSVVVNLRAISQVRRHDNGNCPSAC